MELDDEQRFAVESEDSLMVEAGPGSGKTRILTEKARKEFNSGKNILCLTFTRSAAKEMQSRVPGIPASTIHSYCCGAIGWRDGWGYDGLLQRFLWDKDKTRYDWILLDECQDVNDREFDVVLSLTGDKLFVVGDPYQSIYGFQGALGFGLIEKLTRMGIQTHPLHNNYRSSNGIINKLEKIYKRNLVSKHIEDTNLTCILCRTNDDIFYISRELKRINIPHRLRVSVDRAEQDKREQDILGESNLRLMTIHCAKGLEFDKVILFGWEPAESGEETRVYYVATSRASKEFHQVDTLEELIDLITLGVKV